MSKGSILLHHKVQKSFRKFNTDITLNLKDFIVAVDIYTSTLQKKNVRNHLIKEHEGKQILNHVIMSPFSLNLILLKLFHEALVAKIFVSDPVIRENL